MIASLERGAHGSRSGSAFRSPLLALGLVAAALFGVTTYAAAGRPYLPFDVPLERFIQSLPLAPVAGVFRLVDWLEGFRQLGLGVAAIVLVFFVNRRATPLITVGALSGVAYTVLQALLHRPRPPAGLVHVIRHTSGFSYPSGHAVFFTWFCILLIVCLGLHRLPRLLAATPWLLAVVVILAVGIGRIYDGEHWPSDILGGAALGLAWTSLALSVRRLSDPALERPSPAI